MKPALTWRHSLYVHILLLFALGVTVVIALSQLVEMRAHINASELRLMAQARALSDAMLPVLQNSMVVGDLATVQQTLENVGRQSNLEHLALLASEDRRVLLEIRDTQSSDGAPAWFSNWLHLKVAALETPVAVAGVEYAILQILPS